MRGKKKKKTTVIKEISNIIKTTDIKEISNIILVFLYIVLGALVICHFIRLFCLCPYSQSPQHKADESIPFQLLMFAVVIASFIPMLVYTFSLRILTEAKGSDEGFKELAVNFYTTMDFIVTQSIFLVTLSVLVGATSYLETCVRANIINFIFLISYYFWYFTVAIVWSITDVTLTNLAGKSFPKYLFIFLAYYLWIGAYFIISYNLLVKYLIESLQCLRALTIISSVWLIFFSVFWIIPSVLYRPISKWIIKKIKK